MVEVRQAEAEARRTSGGQPVEELVPLDRASLTQRVTDLIRQAIVNGTLPPAEAISLREVASRLGVSPTPVREALSHLGAVGLVEILPGRVKIVAATPDSLEDSFHLREALEGMTARLAAMRRSDEQCRAIRNFAKLSVKAAKKKDLKGFRAADVAFHRAIADAADSQQLERYTDNALDLALTLRNLRISGRVFDASFAVMHEELAEAIQQRDGAAAERLAREHVRNVGERILAAWRAETQETAASG